MKIKWNQLVICVAIPLAVGALSAFFTKDSMDTFQLVQKPPFSPPGWLFPVVWTILFLLMGSASYLVGISNAPRRAKGIAISVYALQLAINFFWSLIFFNLGAYLFAFVWLILLWIAIWITIRFFYPISKPAAYLLIPYLLWVAFAGYLNWGIFLLN